MIEMMGGISNAGFNSTSKWVIYYQGGHLWKSNKKYSIGVIEIAIS